MKLEEIQDRSALRSSRQNFAQEFGNVGVLLDIAKQSLWVISISLNDAPTRTAERGPRGQDQRIQEHFVVS